MIKHKAPPPVADINVTPMVDVMLVMLIIFMVITPMLSKGVSVDMVKTRNGAQPRVQRPRETKYISRTRSFIMAMAVGGSGGPKSDINMTPMIDVLLVLIIIFMVITPLTPKGLEALVPQPAQPNQKSDA